MRLIRRRLTTTKHSRHRSCSHHLDLPLLSFRFSLHLPLVENLGTLDIEREGYFPVTDTR